jgi:hypothetical protein
MGNFDRYLTVTILQSRPTRCHTRATMDRIQAGFRSVWDQFGPDSERCTAVHKVLRVGREMVRNSKVVITL